MFDCGGPTLVFVTQTHHPLLEHHTGYIFAYYEFQMHKPQELFFQHIAEAQVFALYRRAKLELDPDMKPERVTALDYVLREEDDSRFMLVPDLRKGNQTNRHTAHLPGAARFASKAEIAAALAEKEQAEEQDDVLLDAETTVDDIDFFGGD
jgi:hypothetical protein